jgi:hypothetical protein
MVCAPAAQRSSASRHGQLVIAAPEFTEVALSATIGALPAGPA